jgi:hypothetical protein
MSRPFLEIETKISFADVHIRKDNNKDVIKTLSLVIFVLNQGEIRHHYAYNYTVKANQ